MKSQQRLKKERQAIWKELTQIECHIFLASHVPDTPMGRRIQTQKVKMCARRLQRLWMSINHGLGRNK